MGQLLSRSLSLDIQKKAELTGMDRMNRIKKFWI
jgi:hypothetical protein